MRLFIIVGVLLGIYLLFRKLSSSKSPRERFELSNQESNSDSLEWPIAYRSSAHSEIHSLKIFLESEGVEVILEEVTPGTWGDGVASKHTMRVHPDQTEKAKNLIHQWEEGLTRKN